MLTLVMAVLLRHWREQRGLSVRALAERAGVSYPTISRIESGRMSPTVEMLEKLAKALDIDARDLLAPSKRSKPKRGR